MGGGGRLCRALAGALLGALLAGTATAQTWTASHQFSSDDARDHMLRGIAADLEAAGLTVRVMPGASLMRPRDQWQALIDGNLDLTLLPVDYLTHTIPALAALSLPGMVGSHGRAERLSRAPVMAEFRAMLEAAGAVVIADAWVAGAFGSTGRCLVAPTDAKGMRVRPSGKGFADLWRAAGAVPVSDLGSDALPTLLGSGLVEAVDTSTSSMLFYRLFERLRCVTAPDGASVWFLYEPVLVSRKSFDKLDGAKRQALLEAGRRAETAFFVKSRDIDAAMVKAFAGHGVAVVTLTSAQAEAWTTLARRSSWRVFADKVPGGKDLLGRLRAVD